MISPSWRNWFLSFARFFCSRLFFAFEMRGVGSRDWTAGASEVHRMAPRPAGGLLGDHGVCLQGIRAYTRGSGRDATRRDRLATSMKTVGAHGRDMPANRGNLSLSQVASCFQCRPGCLWRQGCRGGVGGTMGYAEGSLE